MLSTRTILALLNLPQIGRMAVSKLLASDVAECFVDAPDALAQLQHEFGACRLNLPRYTSNGLSEAIRRADAQLADAASAGISVIGIGDARFPRQLRNIPRAPVLLYVLGSVDALSIPGAVAVVGTRSPSVWGEATAERLAQRLAERGITVVSGLAAGCDTAAHRGCLQARGRTVAVLAHGLNTIYPVKNRNLAEQIVANHGCLISEYPPDVRPQRNYFVERDRIQSGLSAGVLVIETGVEGGTMHTATACLQQGRLLACVAHPERHATVKAEGNRLLIERSGAIALHDATDFEIFVRDLQARVLQPTSPLTT